MNVILLPADLSDEDFTANPQLPAQQQPNNYEANLQQDEKQNKNQITISNKIQLTHIKNVLKAQVGDTIKIGQIGGNIGTANIVQMLDSQITVNNLQLTQPPIKKLNLTVILALPRPKVLRRLIMDMTAMGVAKIILVNSYKTEKSYWQSPMLNRLDEFVLEGLQQGVDTMPPVIELKKRFKPFVEDELPTLIKESTNGAIVAHPYAEQSWQQLLTERVINEQALPSILCIGAEGGWIDYEVALLAEQGCVPVSLGQRILRTEAVVNAMVGAWL